VPPPCLRSGVCVPIGLSMPTPCPSCILRSLPPAPLVPSRPGSQELYHDSKSPRSAGKATHGTAAELNSSPHLVESQPRPRFRRAKRPSWPTCFVLDGCLSHGVASFRVQYEQLTRLDPHPLLTPRSFWAALPSAHANCKPVTSCFQAVVRLRATGTCPPVPRTIPFGRCLRRISTFRGGPTAARQAQHAGCGEARTAVDLPARVQQ
jgi:hypothetical protein